MQFTIFALASLIAVALAGPIALPAPVGQLVARAPVNTEDAAMSDASGNVVPFDSAAVTLPLQDAGQ